MNILVIGKFYTEGFALHIADTLAIIGHSVRCFEPGSRSGQIGWRCVLWLEQMRGVFLFDHPRWSKG